MWYKNLFYHWQKIVLMGILLLLIPPIFIWWTTHLHVYSVESIQQTHSFDGRDIPENIEVGIVFGAAAWSTGPSDVFADRLAVAAKLYHAGVIQKILISGDNSKENYNEPETGKRYLIRDFAIPEDDISLDYAGFRTYDTCVRAHKIWDIDKAVLITQGFHLPRAIFTCQYNGIESVGVSASLQPYLGNIKNLIRESFAQQKAFYEVLFFPHDPKFLGDKESL